MKATLIYNLNCKTLKPATWQKDDLFFYCEKTKVDLASLINQIGWTKSVSEARRLLQSGAIDVENRQLKDKFATIIIDKLENNLISIKYKKMYKYENIQFVEDRHTFFNYLIFKAKNYILGILHKFNKDI